jgi:integrase
VSWRPGDRPRHPRPRHDRQWPLRRITVNHHGNPARRDILDEVVTELGYEHLRRHALRHTALTWFADAGVPVHHLQHIAGHGSLTTTQRYLHPAKRSVVDAGALLSRHLAVATSSQQLRVV